LVAAIIETNVLALLRGSRRWSGLRVRINALNYCETRDGFDTFGG
jgi:hypothetical protein